VGYAQSLGRVSLSVTKTAQVELKSGRVASPLEATVAVKMKRLTLRHVTERSVCVYIVIKKPGHVTNAPKKSADYREMPLLTHSNDDTRGDRGGK
jgi:hypothetical protein